MTARQATGSDGNHHISRHHRHGGRRATRPATASNRQQRPRRTNTEPQTAPAPPHLSNERGAERYDDRAKRAKRIASSPTCRPHQPPRAFIDKQARRTSRRRNAEASPRPACRTHGGGRDDTVSQHAAARPIGHTIRQAARQPQRTKREHRRRTTGTADRGERQDKQAAASDDPMMADTAHDDGQEQTTTDGANHGPTDEANNGATDDTQDIQASSTARSARPRDCVFISIDRERGEGENTAAV